MNCLYFIYALPFPLSPCKVAFSRPKGEKGEQREWRRPFPSSLVLVLVLVLGRARV